LAKGHKPHDHFVRHALSHREISVPFFSRYLPEAFRRIVNLDEVQPAGESFVDHHLRELISDLVFSMPRLDREDLAYAYLLFEHKFNQDRDLPVPFTFYQMSALRHFKRVGGSDKYPLILPILLYHGKPDTPFDGPMSLADCIEAPPELCPYPNFPAFILIDLTLEDEDALRSHAWLAVFTTVLRHIHNPDILDVLAGMMPELHEIESTVSGSRFLVTVFVYLLKASSLEKPNLIVDFAVKSVSDEVGGHVMTAADVLRREGRREGRLEGKREGKREGVREAKHEFARNLLREGFPPKDIVRLAGITPMALEKIRDAL